MKPYSNDLRLKVLAALERGMSRKEAAEIFGGSVPNYIWGNVRNDGKIELWDNRSNYI